MSVVLLVLEDALWSALAALGFAMLFNAPRRALPACVLAGALGHGLRYGVMHGLGASLVASSLLGALAVGFLARWCAVRLKMPAIVFAVVGVIPMVPGAYAFRTMIGVLQIAGGIMEDSTTLTQVMTQTVQNGVITALILAALAMGISVPTMIFQRQKPVV
ncbi:MAG: threonine/serine exporter family protein [Anaerolineae bacterium]|nr:threonine/serine exporter family protein [Anaerolineae bacterium]MDW8172976.1 threonine/serine exporter family protein [Anaerolineae bacterium]